LPTNRDAQASKQSGSPERVIDPLLLSVNTFMRRLQVRARRESNDAEVVAYDVLERSIESAYAGEQQVPSRDEIVQRFADQMLRIEKYAAFGLMTQVSAEAIMARLQAASDSQFATLLTMVRPYLDSQRARLDSLKDTYELINQFIDSLNIFLHPKTLSISLLGDLVVKKRGRRLSLAALSSGERQLLRLFTSAAALPRSANLVLIDEPELSLNSEWTRLLTRHLLSETLSSNTQFVFATHSIELLAQFDEAILELRN
jgi:predicted ATP-dependent endonuclease of OLD family